MSFLPQLMGDQLADEVAVGLARGKGAVSAVILEKLVGVREVEVPGEKERVLQFARLVHERMAECGIVLPERRVAQMPKEDSFPQRRRGTEFFLGGFPLRLCVVA